MMINKRLINAVSESKAYIAKTVVFGWIGLLANICAVFSAGLLIEAILQGEAIGSYAAVMIGTILMAIIVRYGCNILSTKMSYNASKKVKDTLREMVYSKLLRLGTAYEKKVSTSEVVQVTVEGVEQLEIYFGRYLPQFFYSLLAPLTLFVCLSFVSLKAALVLLVCVPLIPASIIAVQKFAKKLLSKYWSIYTGLGDSFLENVKGMTTLKIYEADEMKHKEMNEEAELFRKITMKVLTMQLNSVTLMDLVAFGGAALGATFATLEYQAGAITLGQAFVIIMLAAEFFIPLRLLGSYFHIAMNGMAASEKLFKLLDMKEKEIVSEGKTTGKTGLYFDHVNFGYEEKRQILKDVSLEVKEGEMTALVGKSGCGKSTIAALAMGLLSADSGKVTCDGRNVEAFNQASYMEKVTYISHSSYLFKGTVKENLLVGNKKASYEDMIHALKQVKLYDFIKASGDLDMPILEKASNLSGGQIQRLALARAILHDSPIYIFDEATSNIDVESEIAIMEVLKELAKTKTILLITHRLAQTVDADRIYVLEEGSVKEEGNYESLMAAQGRYYDLYQTQADLEKYGKSEGGQHA